MASSASSPEMPAASAVASENLLSYTHATHDEVLEDLSSRFILNLPEEELASLERICFQVEQAHWFYEDFIREQNPKFPTLHLKKFSAMLFNACPMLHQWNHDHEQAFNHFMLYKTRVPVCGAIMLNDKWDKCVLVKGWKPSSGWGFPKGKINEDEPPHACAIREVLEETGYNLAGQLNKEDVIEVSIKEQKIALYIVPNVPEDYPFKTRTRKEISKIDWFKLTDLPTWKRSKLSPGKFYLITPFIGPLKAFINERKPRSPPRKGQKPKKPPPTNNIPREPSPQLPEESSSQSSSMDNGDPQTPSPQYATATATVVQQSSNLDPDKMDPHFARLLSSLSLSAATATGPQEGEKVLTVKTTESVREASTPVPVTASSSGSRSLPAMNDATSMEGEASSLVPTLNPQSLQPIQSPSPLILNPRPSDQPPLTDSEAIMSSPTASIRSLGSRRTASTADISPYLSRSTQMPSTAKRMQQLALLESVADESAKLLQRQTPPILSPPLLRQYPIPPASVPPPPVFDPMQVLYSSGYPIPPQLPPHDPFQVRPWTSQAFHRGPAMSMSQAQIQALANNQRVPMGAYRPPFVHPIAPRTLPTPGDNSGLLSILNGRRG